MTNTHNTDQTRPDNYSGPSYTGPRTRPRKWAILPEADHQQLQQHLEHCESTRHPAWTLLAHVLHHKIMTTEPVTNTHSTDLVTGGCHVVYSVDGGPFETGLLVQRARASLGSGVIPVASLLGATLIGMRVGQRAPLLRDDGTIGTITVLGVNQPT